MKSSVGIGAVALLLVIGGSGYYLWSTAEQAEKMANASPAERGWILIANSGCESCHQAGSGFRAPELKNLMGREITLQDGTKIIADEAYIRESIVEPKAKVSGGYQAVMPSYRDKFTEDELAAIIEATK